MTGAHADVIMKAILAALIVPVVAGTALAKPARPAASKAQAPAPSVQMPSALPSAASAGPVPSAAAAARVPSAAVHMPAVPSSAARSADMPADMPAVATASDVPPPATIDTQAISPSAMSLSDALTATVAPAAPAKSPAATAPAQGDDVTTLDLGADYGLKKRRGALPDVHVEEFEAKSLTENQVGDIVRERAEDLEYCWLRLPAKQRVVSAAILKLSITAAGKVASVEVNGEMPAGVGKCITQMASRWTFPAADAPTEIDHGIMLTTASQK